VKTNGSSIRIIDNARSACTFPVFEGSGYVFLGNSSRIRIASTFTSPGNFHFKGEISEKVSRHSNISEKKLGDANWPCGGRRSRTSDGSAEKVSVQILDLSRICSCSSVVREDDVVADVFIRSLITTLASTNSLIDFVSVAHLSE
jgi:hypothetical protein